jgi:glutaredoxin
MADVVGRKTVPQVFIGGTHVGGCDGERRARRTEQRLLCARSAGSQP